MLPTLLVGIGPRAGAITERAKEVSVSLCPSSAAVLRVFTFGGQPCEDEAELTEKLRALFGDVLDPAALRNARVPAGSPCEVLIVATADEPDSRIVPGLVTKARRTVAETVAGTPVCVVLFLFVPRGTAERNSDVPKLIEGVTKLAGPKDPQLDRVYLVSGVSTVSQYTLDDTDAMLEWALALRIAEMSGETLRAIEGNLADNGQRIATFGLSMLELDSDSIARRAALNAAHSIVREGILAPCDRAEQIDTIAEEAKHDLKLTHEGVREKRLSWRTYDVGGEQRDVFEDLTIPHIAFEQIHRRKWHILIGNYALFFRRERLEIARHRVRCNIANTIESCEKRIRTAVDSAINSGRDPSNTFRLLEQLHAEATGARSALVVDRTKQHEKVAPAPRLASLLPQLADAASREPYLPAMLFRTACAAAAIATALMAVCRMNWIPDLV